MRKHKIFSILLIIVMIFAVNFSSISPLEQRLRKKAEKNLAIANRSLAVIDALVAGGI